MPASGLWNAADFRTKKGRLNESVSDIMIEHSEFKIQHCACVALL